MPNFIENTRKQLVLYVTEDVLIEGSKFHRKRMMSMALSGAKIYYWKYKEATGSYTVTEDILIKGSISKRMIKMAYSRAKIHGKYREATGSFKVNLKRSYKGFNL